MADFGLDLAAELEASARRQMPPPSMPTRQNGAGSAVAVDEMVANEAARAFRKSVSVPAEHCVDENLSAVDCLVVYGSSHIASQRTFVARNLDRIISTLPFAALATHLAPVLRAYAADDDPVIRAEIASHVCALQRRLQDEAVAVADSNSSSSLLASTVVAVLATVLGVPADVTEGDPADDGLDLPHRHAKRAWQELIQDVLSSARIITLLDNIISGAVATSTSAAVSSTSESSGDASGKWGVPSDDDDEDDADGDSATKFNVIAAAVVPPMMLRLPASSPRYSDTAVALRLLAYACPVVDRVIVVERIMPAVERFTSVEAARSDVGLALLDLIEAVIVRVGSHRDDGMEVLSKMLPLIEKLAIGSCHRVQSRVIALVGTIAASHGTTRGWSPARLFSLLLPLHRRIVGACANNAYWLKGDLAATTCQLMALASRCNDSGDECTVLDVDFLCAALTSALGTARMLSARHRARFAILLGAAMPAYLTTATSWTTLSGYLTPLFKDQEARVRAAMASTLPALIHHVKQRDDTTLERSCLLSQVDSYLTPQEDHAVVSAIISALPALLKVLSEHTMMAPKAVCGSAQTGTRMVTRRMSMEMEAAPTLSTTATTGANVDHGHRLLSKLADIIKRSGPKWRVRLSIAENLPAISKSAAASTTADTSTPATDSHITPLIAALCRDQVSDVRQAAVALLAEMRPWTSAISSVVCALAHESTYTHRLQFVKVCRAVMMASVSCEGEESSSEMTALRSELRALEARETVRVVREAIMAMPAALSMNASTCVQ